MGVTLRGGPELADALRSLADVREIDAATAEAARLVQNEAASEAPGSLGDTVDFTEDKRRVEIGSDSPYSRWFHVPYLSEGNVLYAKKESKRGRSYGQRIPDNPWLFRAAKAVQDDVRDAYITAVGDLIDRALGQK